MLRDLRFRLPHCGTGSATPITIDFGAIFPFTDVPACNLPVYASQWPLPDTTQDSVRGCSLGFTAAAIPGDRVQRTCTAQPAQILARPIRALGSLGESYKARVRPGVKDSRSPVLGKFQVARAPALSRPQTLLFPGSLRETLVEGGGP
jgi:hypothetical protein